MVLLFFCAIFLLAHLHLFFKITNVFSLSTEGLFFLAVLLLFMAVSPLSIYFFARGSGDYPKKTVFISNMWVAFLILFFATALSFDVYNLVAKLVSSAVRVKTESMILIPSRILSVSSLLSAVFLIVGFFNAKKIRVENITVMTSKLPPALGKLRVVQISDLHLGITLGKEMVDKVNKIIEAANPDLIVSTGDLLNAEIDHIDYLTEDLKKIDARFGKFAVTGNHELYAGIDHSVKFTEDSGFTLLRGKGVTVDETINIAGVDDIAVKKMGFDSGDSSASEEEILSGLPEDKFTLLLKHRPLVRNDSLGLFDLQLSGHTHKGQIFPVHLAIMIFFPYFAGYYKLAKGSALYTSRGVGTAGPPVRFLAPPEVTVIDLVSIKDN